ncbi:MAG: IclR family transcriptional regulator [Candidatus Bipolaricaulota bacterium]|nr:IclR family transcriptional regulator [Candidatus Bipolaricaulota bacterium]
MGNDVSSNKSTILSVERAVILLREMSETDTPIGVRELARTVGYSPSTVQKLLSSLEVQGLVRQDEKTEGYELGLGICRLGASVLNQLDVHQIARPHLGKMMEKTKESSYLALLTPDLKWYVFVDKVESTHLLRWTADLGAWRPLNCTAEGKATLAYLPDDHLEFLKSEGAFRKSTPNSITDPERLREELNEVREKGWAYSDEEFAEGVRAIAAPVFDYSETVIGAISVVGPTLRLTDEKVHELTENVKEEGRAISLELGLEEDEEFYG